MTLALHSLFRLATLVILVTVIAAGASHTDTAHAQQVDDSLPPLADLTIASEYADSSPLIWMLTVKNNTVGAHPGVHVRLVKVRITTSDPVRGDTTRIWTIRDLPPGGSVMGPTHSLNVDGVHALRNVPGATDGPEWVPQRLYAEIIESDPVESPRFRFNNATEHWAVENRQRGNFADGEVYITNGDVAVDVSSISDRLPRPGGATTFMVAAYARDDNVSNARFRDLVADQNHRLFDVQVQINLSQGLSFAANQPEAPSGVAVPDGTTFDTTTGIWNMGTLISAVSDPLLQVEVNLTADSLADLPLEERCLTAKVVSAVPWFANDPFKRQNDSATACLGNPQTLVSGNDNIDLFEFYPCIGVTTYPCTSANTLELLVEQGSTLLQPESAFIHVEDPRGRRTKGGSVIWSTVDIFDLRDSQTRLTPSWSVKESVTVTAPGGGDAPGRWLLTNTDDSVANNFDLLDAPDSTKVTYDYFSLSSEIGNDPTEYFIDVKIDFWALGTYKALFEISGRLSGNTYTDSATYTFHVGPVADLELKAAWDAPGVLTLTALNHGPDDAPAARVTVTPPPGLRFARGEAAEGSYANGVWDIGELETPQHRRAAGLPEGATLTIYTEPAANVGTPDRAITASIENTQDYCVRIKTGATDPENDLDCAGALPSGYTQHSAAYYDYRPENNRVSLSADWTAAPSVAATRLTGVAITSEGGYQPGDDIEVTATFNDDVRVSGRPGLRLRVGEVTREAALHSHSYDTIVFRYRVQESDSDAVDGVSVPPSPIALSQVASIAGPGDGRVSLFFAGLDDDPAHRVYPGVDRAEGSSVLMWSPAGELFTGVDGARYRLFDRMRHYYRWNETTQRWEMEFRIADAGLDSPDLNLVQWLMLRADGYYLLKPHLYGAAPVEMKPWLGGWTDHEQLKQQICVGLKAEFSPGRTRGQRLEELGDVEIERLSHVGFGRYDVYAAQNVARLLASARDMISETTCPDPPAGVVTIQGQASTRGEFGAVLYDPNGVVEGSESWQWKRSPDGATPQVVSYTGFENIPGANEPSYAPGAQDVGRWLRVKASYTDGQRSTRTAWGQSLGPVQEPARDVEPVRDEPTPVRGEPVEPIRGEPVGPRLVPAGLEPGDSFRLLFVTSATRTATSTDIADYNAFVRNAASANADLSDFSDRFTALVSTGGVNIKDNTATGGAGVPIYWLGGDRVADDYADLYDLHWDSVSGRTEDGSSYTGLVWTGGNGYGDTSLRRYAGAAEVRMGDLSDDTRALSSPTHEGGDRGLPALRSLAGFQRGI